MPVHRPPDIGHVAQHAVQGRGIPKAAAASVRNTGLLQTATYFAQAQPLQADPGEDEPHEPCFLRHHVEPRHATTLVLRHVAIPERGGGESAQQTRTCRVTASTPATLQNLGPLILGNHALHLQQQIILGRAANRPVHEQHLHPGAAELFHQQSLVCVAPGQSVGSKDIQLVDAPRRSRVAQPFQRRTNKDRAAVTLVDIGVIRLELPTIGGNPLAEGRDLAGNGVVARLPLGRDACIEGDMTVRHAYLRLCGLACPPVPGSWVRTPRLPAGSGTDGRRR